MTTPYRVQNPQPPVLDETTGLDVRINKRLPHISLTGEDGTVARYVPMQAHLDLMDERDEYRRVVALINALRSEHAGDLLLDGHGDFFGKLTSLLTRLGEDDDTARATRSIIEWFQRGATSPSAATSDA